MRSEKKWLEYIPELKDYWYIKTNSNQNVCLTKNNLSNEDYNELKELF